MLLGEALKRVLAACPPKASKSPLRYVRAINNNLYCTNSIWSSCVPIDGGITNTLLPADPLVALSKNKGDIAIVPVGNGEMKLQWDKSALVIQGVNADSFPKPVEFPLGGYTTIDTQGIKAVLHASGTDKIESALQVVAFFPDYIECLDKRRLARYTGKTGLNVVIPAQIFSKLTTKTISIAYDSNRIYIKAGEELRTCLRSTVEYPDTRQFIFDGYKGSCFLVDKKELLAGVKEAKKQSSTNLVKVYGTDKAFRVESFSTEYSDSTYSTSTEILHTIMANGYAPALVYGQYLIDALKQVTTPSVFISYCGAKDPLKIQSGNFTSLVWLMVD